MVFGFGPLVWYASFSPLGGWIGHLDADASRCVSLTHQPADLFKVTFRSPLMKSNPCAQTCVLPLVRPIGHPVSGDKND
jgi:hypothetical protein